MTSLNDGRQEELQRREGLWITVDGGSYQERRLLTTALGEHLQTLGFENVRERTGEYGLK